MDGDTEWLLINLKKWLCLVALMRPSWPLVLKIIGGSVAYGAPRARVGALTPHKVYSYGHTEGSQLLKTVRELIFENTIIQPIGIPTMTSKKKTRACLKN